jgi:radical S-adenosyl methionine domain-containing protein 2
VNLHITLLCDLACRFCFQQKSDRPVPMGRELYIPLEKAFTVLDRLCSVGCRKLTFAGGEPTLVPQLPALIRHAWAIGMEVMLVTNGFGVDEDFLQEIRGCLSALKLSIDSPSEATLIALGRSRGAYLERVRRVARLCHRSGVPVMMNTVVTRLNWEEDLHQLVSEIHPRRWKVFQALRVKGQNEAEIDDLTVTAEQFKAYLARHQDIPALVPEDNVAMTDTYVMVDPWGRVFQNSSGAYRYGREIQEVGVETSLVEAGGWDRERFLLRGGDYEIAAPGGSLARAGDQVPSPRTRIAHPAGPNGWRIRIDSRAEPGALFNLKHRMFDWLRNNPSGRPSEFRIHVRKDLGSLFIESTRGDSRLEMSLQEALRYAKGKATKSQRFVAGASLETTGWGDG